MVLGGTNNVQHPFVKKLLCTLWGLVPAKKSCNNINNSHVQVSRIYYFLWLWYKLQYMSITFFLLSWTMNYFFISGMLWVVCNETIRNIVNCRMYFVAIHIQKEKVKTKTQSEKILETDMDIWSYTYTKQLLVSGRNSAM